MALRAILSTAIFGVAVLSSPIQDGLRKRQSATPEFTLVEVGAPNTIDWRVWLQRDGAPASFWHDVPIYPEAGNNTIVNMVVEIPRWTNGKIEINREEDLNPIFHDESDDAPRFVQSVYPHKSYPFIYGSIPQTWESPNFNHSFTNFPGDNDPMDIIDIGQFTGHVGQVKRVKVLGGLALNDGEETDWKIMAIDVEDPIAHLVESYEDVEQYRPGLVKAFRDWFTYYKVARGDGVLPIVGDFWQNSSFSHAVIEESHGFWEELVAGTVDTNEINYNQTSNSELESFANDTIVESFELPGESAVEPAAEIPAEYLEWYFLKFDRELIEENHDREEL